MLAQDRSTGWTQYNHSVSAVYFALDIQMKKNLVLPTWLFYLIIKDHAFLSPCRGFCVHWSSVNFSTFEKGVKSTHLTWRTDGTLHSFLENTLGTFAMHLPAPWIGRTK